MANKASEIVAKKRAKKSAQGLETVERTVLFQGEELGREDETSPIQVRPFLVQPAGIEISAGMTWQPKRFYSANLKVGYIVPCYREEMPDVEEQIWNQIYLSLNEQREYLNKVVKEL